MTGQELVDEVKAKLRDTATPRLWTDARILALLNRMENIFTEKTHCLVDLDTFTLDVDDSTSAYALDRRILNVLVAQVEGEPSPLKRYNSSARYGFTTLSSKPAGYMLAASKPVTLLLNAVPDDDYVINMVCAIYPYQAFTLLTSPSIDARYHHDLVYGACMEALGDADTDGYDPDGATRYERKWELALVEAKREAYRMGNSFNVIASGG